MSTLKSSAEDLTLNADGSGNDIIFQSNGSNVATLDQAGLLTATTFAGSAASLTAIPAANITGTLPAIDGSSLTGIAGRRNMIINGDMRVSQRGTSWAAIANATYTLDHWELYNNGIGAYTVTQDSTGPTGFANSFKIDCTTADASPTGSDYLLLYQRFEGQDLQLLKKGTASAESVTLSFWVKSNKTGNGQVNLQDMDNTRMIGNTYTISSADTWEQKTITFAGDTTGAFNDDNGESLKIEWWFDSGSSYASGSTPTSWEAAASTDRNAGGTLALADSTSNYINITGVQLEVGTAATDFEYRSYGEELALCQRYYQRLGPGGVSVNNSSAAGTIVAGGTNSGAITGYVGLACVQYVVSKRAVPTITVYDADSPRNTGKCSRHKLGTARGDNQAVVTGDSGTRSFSAYSSGTHTATGLIFHFAADAEL